MKTLFTLMAMILFCTAASAQKPDTIRIGGMVIIKKKGNNEDKKNDSAVTVDTVSASSNADTLHIGNMAITREGTSYENYEERHENGAKKKRSNISTNWLIVDIGFSNYVNKTSDYSSGGYIYNRTGTAPIGENDFELNVGKSINVNIWFFMQRLNLLKHHLHLKYGLGLELNNYRYQSHISYLKENPFVSGVAPAPVITRDSITFSKNKLAADYLTVPFMLSYSSNPNNQHKGFSISVGVSAGYLYSQRNKQISEERGKQKTKGSIGVEQFKFSYVGEIGLGPVRLYGSYSPTSFYKKQLDMRPYTLGIRLSNW